MAENKSSINETRVFGPPGTGKTTLISRYIAEAAEKYDPDKIVVASFTRAAAKELIGRDLPIKSDQVGTLHAICYRMLGNPDIAESKTKDFNEQYPHFAVTQSDTVKMDDGLAPTDEGAGQNSGDDLLAQLGIYRARMVRKELWAPTVLDFHRAWEGYKRDVGLADFQDLIDRALDVHYPPFQAQIGIFDEVQDFTPVQLKLIRRWAKYMEWILLAGDDDQASAPWSKILTTGGQWISAELVNSEIHSLTTYVQERSQIAGITRCGRNFIKEKSRYTGFMHELHTETSSTDVTHNHPSIFRFTEAAKEKTCVYLMKKGTYFRVGWCQIVRADGCLHFSIRCKNENADEGWILDVFDNRSEASLMESYVASHFGISTVIWKPMHDQSNGHYSEDIIRRLFEKLGDQSSRAISCLEFFGKDINKPFYIKGNKTTHGSVNYKSAACNLFPEIMALPVYNGSKIPSWEIITKIERRWYDGHVFSFLVEKDHTYISDGIITHNCLYSFTGATPEAFLNPPVPQEFKKILRQSYRVPTKILNLSNNIVRKLSVREPKEYRPRDHDGKIFTSNATWKKPDNVIPVIKGYVSEGKRVMVLATCSYMLGPLIAQLRDRGIPFSNIYKANRGDWNPIRKRQTGNAGAYGRLCAYMAPQGAEFQGVRLWTPGQLESWTEPIRVDGNFQRGAKSKLREMCKTKELAPEVVLGAMLEALSEDAFDQAVSFDLEWFLSQITPAKQKAYDFPSRVYKECGLDGPEMAKMVTVGTVHSVKGAECDCCIVFPDISLRGAQHYAMRQGEQFEQILRQFYVAVTRTRDILVLCQGLSRGMFFDDYK